MKININTQTNQGYTRTPFVTGSNLYQFVCAITEVKITVSMVVFSNILRCVYVCEWVSEWVRERESGLNTFSMCCTYFVSTWVFSRIEWFSFCYERSILYKGCLTLLHLTLNVWSILSLHPVVIILFQTKFSAWHARSVYEGWHGCAWNEAFLNRFSFINCVLKLLCLLSLSQI